MPTSLAPSPISSGARPISRGAEGSTPPPPKPERGHAMTALRKFNRRSFLVSAAALGGGLSLGFRIPFGLVGAQAAQDAPEVNAWVVVRPDDTVVIRIARSEMGQGTL